MILLDTRRLFLLDVLTGGGAGGADVTAPTITSTASHNVLENAPYSATATANEVVTWSKGGTDAGLVTLNTSTGAWSVAAQDFETTPVVTFTLTATDAASNATTQTITLTIGDVAETVGQPVGLLLVLTKAA